MIKRLNKSSQALGERRSFSRVHFEHEITMTSNNGRVYKGAFNDISLKGMLFWADPLPKAKEILVGALPLGEDQINIHGEVLWSNEEKGTAIKFIDMDVESFSHLRRLIALNMGDSEKVDRELFASL